MKKTVDIVSVNKEKIEPPAVYSHSAVVYKSSEFLLSQFSLSTLSQKLICYCLSTLTPEARNDANAPLVFNLTVSELVDFLDAKTSHGYYKQLAIIGGELIDTKIKIYDEERENFIFIAPFTYAAFTGQGTHRKFRLELNRYMNKHLLNFSEVTPHYVLANVNKMRSQYAIRMYEICKNYEFGMPESSEIIFRMKSIELRETIGLVIRQYDERSKRYVIVKQKYERDTDMEKFILRPCAKQMKECTDIYYEYTKSYDDYGEGELVTVYVFKVIRNRDIFEKDETADYEGTFDKTIDMPVSNAVVDYFNIVEQLSAMFPNIPITSLGQLYRKASSDMTLIGDLYEESIQEKVDANNRFLWVFEKIESKV